MKCGITILLFLVCDLSMVIAQQKEEVFPGADEKSPSRSMYFSWVNNGWEGATEKLTNANLDFFKWMHDEYGMKLDIYLLDAGTIDGSDLYWQKGIAADQSAYGSLDSDEFMKRFPNGLGPITQKARTFGCRLGMWLGPDGFGETDQEARIRKEMLVSLSRDYDMELFKFDLCCSDIRSNKEKWFAETMAECRKYTPDLIALNHRINLSDEARKYTTTFLWEGQETYIDIHIANDNAAIHHRVKSIQRGLPPNLSRLTEDHGVCLSSHLDFWEDELVVQAFNRNLILAPEIYGNPWFLKDSEFPKLARIFNLHRQYREILPAAILLPEDKFGKDCVSRGNDVTRFISFKNMRWTTTTYKVVLHEEIGLKKAENVTVQQYFPTERFLGEYNFGETIDVAVLPFRTALIKVSSESMDEIVVEGTDYEVVKEVADRPVVVKLMAFPGEKRSIRLNTGNRSFKTVEIDGEAKPELLNGRTMVLQFGGEKLNKPFHRKLADLTISDEPSDIRAIYEATCFSASNDAYEIGCIKRAGKSGIPQVEAARNAFFNHFSVIQRGISHENLFDDDRFTFFNYPMKDNAIHGGGFRIDFGKSIDFDKLILEEISPEYHPSWAESSNDLQDWKRIKVGRRNSALVVENTGNRAVRYIHIQGCPVFAAEVNAYKDNQLLDRTGWKANHLFSAFDRLKVQKIWKGAFVLDEVAKNSYFALAIRGEHGEEGAYAALKIDGEYVGAIDRAPGFKAVHLEAPTKGVSKNYTYYFEVTPEMEGKRIEAYVMAFNEGKVHLKPEIWITAYPIPSEEKMMVLR